MFNRGPYRLVLDEKKTYNSWTIENKSDIIKLESHACSMKVLILCALQGIYGILRPIASDIFCWAPLNWPDI